MIIVLMGVSGVGQTTIAQLLAQRLGISFVDGDDFHSPANIAKMQRGEPLTDGDRAPWVESLQEFVQNLLETGQGAVIACSALKAAYRQQLGAARGLTLCCSRVPTISFSSDSTGARGTLWSLNC